MDDARETTLDERLFERCEAVPADPPPGNYVVVDTMHFSNTVIELLANGAEHVHITDERGQEFAYREANPRAVLGGSSTDAYEPAAGYDFFNSPSYVQDVDVAGRPVSMTSSNGGRAVTRLRDAPDVEVYVGSTMNAAAVADRLRGAGETYLVSAGSRGEIAVEDLVGATLIGRRLDGHPVSAVERELFRRQLRTAKGPGYVDTHELRRRDVIEYAMAIDSREVVPRLEGATLVDAARRGPPAAD